MRYGTVIEGRFLSRPNRFIAMVETEQGMERVHVKTRAAAGSCWYRAPRCIWPRGRIPTEKPPGIW